MERPFDDGSDSEPLPPKAGKRGRKDEAESYEELATIALSRARSLLKKADAGAAPDPMVELMLQSAQVLATLELAAAIRSASGASGS
jgi:hypothetical protein